MWVRRGASLLAVLAGCSGFSGEDAQPSAAPSDAGLEANALADAASPPGNEAGPSDGGLAPPFCPTLGDLPDARARRCWDFTSADVYEGFDAKGISGGAVFERDQDVATSSPASLHARIPASQPQVLARGVFDIAKGKLTPGRYHLELSLLADCAGGKSDGGDQAPPSVVELYCVDDIDPGSLLRVDRASNVEYDVIGANLVTSKTKSFPVAVSPDGWHRLGIDVSLFDAIGEIQISLDGVEGTPVPIGELLQCAAPGATLQLLLGVQDSKSNGACDVHYDDVLLEWPTP